MNILSSLDYNKKNREELYWVIYQLLNIIYKYYNRERGDGNDNISDHESESESISMVLTQSKSKYAELKPPPRKGKKISSKSKSIGKSINKSKTRGSFSTLENVSSASSDNDSQR